MGGAGIPPRDLPEILQELFKLVEAHADFILTLLADSGGSLIMYKFLWSVQLCRQFFFFFFFFFPVLWLFAGILNRVVQQ